MFPLSANENKPFVVAVVGPTASGKTAMGVKLAKEFDGEVISADSMQIYKGMDISTAKPSAEEMQQIVDTVIPNLVAAAQQPAHAHVRHHLRLQHHRGMRVDELQTARLLH